MFSFLPYDRRSAWTLVRAGPPLGPPPRSHKVLNSRCTELRGFFIFTERPLSARKYCAGFLPVVPQIRRTAQALFFRKPLFPFLQSRLLSCRVASRTFCACV